MLTKVNTIKRIMCTFESPRYKWIYANYDDYGDLYLICM